MRRGLRVADLLISIDKGKTSEISNQILHNISNVILITGRINTTTSAIAAVYYTDSAMLRDIIETIKSIPFVSKVEFAEVVEIFGRRLDKQIKENINRHLIGVAENGRPA